MTANTSPVPHDLAGLLAAQHGHVRRLFHDATSSTGIDRATAFDRLARFLAIHEAAEQVALHGPGVHRLGVDAALAQSRITEEQGASAQVERLFDLDPDDSSFGIQLGLLEEAVVKHATAEETEELPRLLTTMDADGIRKAEIALSGVEEVFEQDGDEGPVPSGSPFAEQHRAAVALFEERVGVNRPTR